MKNNRYHCINKSSLFVFLIVMLGFCKSNVIPGEYGILTTIRAPDQLILPLFPPCYTVPITLSGDLASEMAKALTKSKIESPQYKEVLDKKHQFHLYLANMSYSIEMRELLAGVLNPIEMIDIIVSSVLKYKSPDQFQLLVNETKLTVLRSLQNGRVVFECTLLPKGQYFSYSFEDKGPFSKESWLTTMVIRIDSTTHVVHELNVLKHTRVFTVNQGQKPPFDTVSLRYTFSYDTVDASIVPSHLFVYVNDKLSLSMSATYRTEGKYLVFETRKICYPKPQDKMSQPTCLSMNYGTYEMNAMAQFLKTKDRSSDYGDHMEQASILSSKASSLLRNGSIQASIPLLKKIIDKYPETPQAAEARELLSGLPSLR